MQERLTGVTQSTFYKLCSRKVHAPDRDFEHLALQKTPWIKASGSSASFNNAVTAVGPSPSSSAIGGVEIKVEHPQLVELRCRVVVGKSPKGFLERRLTEGKELLSLLVAKSKTQTALQMEADELRTAMAALEQHISHLRVVVAEAECRQHWRSAKSLGICHLRLRSAPRRCKIDV